MNRKNLCLAHVAVILLVFATTAYAQPLPIGNSYKLGYSPAGQSLKIIIDAIEEAEVSILVAAYSFTSKPIATALLAVHKRGVQVQVVADAKANRGQYTATTFLANQGVPVRLNSKYAIMHHKFMIIDGKHVQTGSFNYSAAAASRNAENVLLLLNVPELAEEYMREWQLLWDKGEPLKAAY